MQLHEALSWGNIRISTRSGEAATPGGWHLSREEADVIDVSTTRPSASCLRLDGRPTTPGPPSPRPGPHREPPTPGDRRCTVVHGKEHVDVREEDPSIGRGPREVVPVTITLIVAGILVIALIAVVVGIVDAAQAGTWREIAAQRRRQWLARQPEFHGVDGDAWDED